MNEEGDVSLEGSRFSIAENFTDENISYCNI